MEEYNKMISSKVLDNIHLMIDDVPQPTMFGGKRQRDFVLPASTDYDYPASLAVGHLKTSGMPNTLGGSFWSDFGETEFLDEDHDQYQMEGGAVWRDADGNIHSTPQPRMPRKVGGKFNLGKKLKPVKPIATEVGVDLAVDALEGGRSKQMKMLNKTLKSAMPALNATSDVLNLRAPRGGKRNGSVLKTIGKTLSGIGSEIFKGVLIPEGKRALRDYIKSWGRPSTSNEGEYSGEIAYATPYYGKGKNRRNPPPSSVRKQSNPQRPSDKVASMIGRDYSDFSASKVSNASKWIKEHYAPPKKARKPRKVKNTRKLVLEDSSDEENSDEEIVIKSRRGPKGPIGGVLIRDMPSEFHSSVYPPALESYTPHRDAYGRGCGGKKSKIGKYLKPVAPIAKELGMAIAKEGIKEGVKYMFKPKAEEKTGSGRGSGRGAIVKEVMRKHGLSLPEASKFVKQNNLY